MTLERLTSAEWQKRKPTHHVRDPDGWDRANFNYSWFEELITEREYNRRVSISTIEIHVPNSFPVGRLFRRSQITSD